MNTSMTFYVRALCLLVLACGITAEADELHKQQIEESGISIELTAERQEAGAASSSKHMYHLVFRYTVTNNSDSPWALFTIGHTGKAFNGIVYTEAFGERNVEFSLKAFHKPVDRSCPRRYLPIIPKAVLLLPGDKVRGQAVSMLPPRLHTPFDDCSPPAFFPESIDKARFCLGATRLLDAEADHVALGNIPADISNRQQLLCSDLFDL
ncbi:MAG TPA: hypothetical protein EYP10_05855 [Armatimonadetes bacterium]|nr:hypothetical protein [Armatimonadota bacterium]